MGVTEIFAFIKALPEMVKVLGRILDTLEGLRAEAIHKELDQIKSDVATTLKQIEGAKTNEDRKRLSLELATRLSK